MIHSLDLFTGYGGISFALKEYIKPIAYCDIESYARAIIASRIECGDLPLAPILPDVRSIEGEVGSADIITAGFPCQDISVAGVGKGLEGERSGLFFEVIRLTKEIKPAFVFLENVPAIRTRGLDQVIKAFTEVGYDCRWTCLSASSVGAPHKRERWFLLAHSNRESKVIRQTKKWKQNIKSIWAMEGEDWHHNASEFLRMGYGDSFRVDRVKACGNGVVPQQVKEAFETLIGLNMKEYEV